MAVTVKQFVHGLVDSGIMTVDGIRQFRDSLPPAKRRSSAETLIRELVTRGKVTTYQVTRISAGQSKGLVLGNNVILDKIGEGGMGEVFRAEHRRMKRPVVVKVLPESATKSAHAIQRFQREVEAAAQLSHPNIVTAFDADEENGIYFLVMEFVDGEDLGSIVSREGPMSFSRAIDCIIQAAQGLEYAHSRGMVHRDIKPDNLLLDRAGVVKILDMGLARFDLTSADMSRTQDMNLTRDDQIVGTVDYMSPEQADDSSRVDQRSDIYSLGCTMFRLLTGQTPYAATSLVQKLIAHRVDPIPSLRESVENVPDALDQIFQKMVAKKPDDRYQCATDVIRDLTGCAEQFTDETEFDLVDPTTRTPVTGASAARTRVVSKSDWHAASPQAPSDPTAQTSHGDVTRQTTVDRRSSSAMTRPLVPSGDRGGATARPVGIDLGTTFSAVAYIDDVGRPLTLTNSEGDITTPSVVLFDDPDVIVGKEAVKAMATDMDSIAECAKRQVGEPLFHKMFGDQTLPPEVIEAYVLNKLRLDSQRQIGNFDKVVITVPAYFDETRRKATQDAGYIAGLDVLDIINEPTAAAIAYGFQQVAAGESEAGWQTILVYDLGGGTFDVTIMETDGREFIALATDGDVKLGGRDWDERLVEYVRDLVVQQHGVDPQGDANAMGRLWRACEDAKRTLSVRQKTSIDFDYHGHSLLVEMTRDKFHELTSDLLERTDFTVRQTLQAAGVEWSDIDQILLIGGSSRMPAVVDMLVRISGKNPDTSISPDEAVAHGAALHAALILQRGSGIVPKFTVTNVNSHNLGVVGTETGTGRKKTSVLIPRNTALPVSADQVFFTQKDDQRSVLVKIVEGESEIPDECSLVGHCAVLDLPAGLPARTPVDIRFHYEENGCLTVTVKVAGTDKFVKHEITRENRLSQQVLDEWRQRVSGMDPVDSTSITSSR